MTIKRVINGMEVEITLNSVELRDAYREKQHEYDLEDVENYLEYYSEDEIMQEYGVTIDKFHCLKEEMASLYRKYRSNDESWARDRDEAVEYIGSYERLIGRTVFHKMQDKFIPCRVTNYYFKSRKYALVPLNDMVSIPTEEHSKRRVYYTTKVYILTDEGRI